MLPGTVAGGARGLPGALMRRTVLYAALWAVLTGSAGSAWIAGIPLVALAVALSLALGPPARCFPTMAGLPRFLLFFMTSSVRSGVQVAVMALRPRPALHPAMLEIDLALSGEGERIFLASLLNLLPGTLSCGLEGQRLHLHVLDRRGAVERDVRLAEAQVARLFGQPP